MDKITNLTNIRFLNFNNNHCDILKTDIAIQKGIVISDKKLEGYSSVDLSDWVIMPPFFNLHAHLGESVFRDITGSDWTLEKYLRYTDNHNIQLDESALAKEWKVSAEYTILEQQRHGIFSFCAARSAEISLKYNAINMSGYPIMHSEKLKKYSQRGLEGFKEYYSCFQNPNCSIGIFLHSIYRNDLQSLKLAYDCLNVGAKFLTCHISEDAWSRQKEISSFNTLPIFTLHNHGLLNANTILVHCGYLEERELELVARQKAHIVICPISNKFLNTSIINPVILNKYNISWSVATDGIATGRTFSLLKQCNSLKKCYPNVSYNDLLASIMRRNSVSFTDGLSKFGVKLGSIPVFVGIKSKETEINSILSKLFRDENVTIFNFNQR